MNRWMKLALKTAAFGVHHQHKMAAVVVRGGSMLSKEANLSRPFGIDNCGHHAEERALKPHHDYSGATIYVARQNGSMSRPCISCLKMIRTRGITKIVYFDWDGNLVIERIK